MGATEKVARWIASTTYEDIPPDAIRVAAQACFDCLGVILAGASHPLGATITDYVRESGGTPESTLVGAGIRTSAPWAALGNGTLGHALDYDDMGAFGHPTVVLFPALLALGEKLGATGRDLLAAYVVGCEVGINLTGGGVAMHAYHQMKRGFHSTGIFGRLAATAACAKLLNLDERQTRMALGIAGSMASGLVHNFGTWTKPLHAGITARDGVMAAQLAARGWTAGERILEDPLGFVPSFFGEGQASADDLVARLGNPFRTQSSVIIKKYPCCGGNHSMLDSLLGLIREHRLTLDDVDEVEIDQSFLSIVMLYTQPQDGLQGKFSIQYNAAAALAHGTVDMDTFADDSIHNPRIQEAMRKVRIRVMSKWEEGAETIQGGTPVRVRLKNGATLERTTDRKDILGTQFNPWGFDNIRAKFETNAALALPPEQVRRAADTWSDIAAIKDLRAALHTVVAPR